MIVECSWCKKFLKEKAPLDNKDITHTICEPCMKKLTKKNPPIDWEHDPAYHGGQTRLVGPLVQTITRQGELYTLIQRTVHGVKKAKRFATHIEALAAAGIDAAKALVGKNPTKWEPPSPLTLIATSRSTKDQFFLAADGVVYVRTLSGWVNHGTLEEFTTHAERHWKPLHWEKNPPLTFTVQCTANGCMYRREGLTRKTANQAATSHLRTAQHDAVIVKENPGEAWHMGKMEEAEYSEKHVKKPSLKDFYHGKATAHFESALTERAGKRTRKNPLAVFGLGNPPKEIHAKIEGIIYRRCLEVKAEKTGAWQKGLWKHPFSKKSQVSILALDNGDLLLHSAVGVKLWKRG